MIKESEDGGIFDLHAEKDLHNEEEKLRKIAQKYGPSIDDMRIALEENRNKYQATFKIDRSDEEIREYLALAKEIEILEALLSNYDHLTPEDKQRMNTQLENLVNKNTES